MSVHQVIDGVLRRYLADGSLDRDDADEVRSVVLLRFAQLGRTEVRSVDDYVATMTHNAARDVFRNRHPDRARLRKRMRAIVRDDDRFVFDDPWCALREHARLHATVVPLTTDDFAAARALPLAEIVVVILKRAAAAIAFDRLIDCVIEISGLALAGETTPLEECAVDEPDATDRLIAHETLAALWNAICALPLPQRTALLLHLRDEHGSSAIPLLVFTGTAALQEIATALQLEPAQLERIGEELPMSDHDIATLLDTTASRVVGLRRAARERLGRMLRKRG